MQTERVTYLTSAEQKAALEAYAKDCGMSVGHVLREAATKYVAEGEINEDGRFRLLIDEMRDALPYMHAALDHAIMAQQNLRADIDRMLREAGLRS
jgi:hypothetical protein